MDLRAYYKQHAAMVWTIGILIPIAALVVGVVVDPLLFWDHYLWVNIVGPTVVDAQHWAGTCWAPPGNVLGGHAEPASLANGQLSCPQGQTLATTAYTVPAELTYAVTLAVILYGIWNLLLRRGKVQTDGWFLFALLPYIVYGSVVRVLEDSHVFDRSCAQPCSGAGAGMFSYFYISPFEYMLIGVFAIAALSFGVLLRNVKNRTTYRERLWIMGSALAFTAAAIGFFENWFAGEFLAHASDLWEFGAAAVGLLIYAYIDRRGGRVETAATFAIGLPILAPSIGLVAIWAQSPWLPVPAGFNAKIAIAILGCAITITAAVAVAGWLFRKSVPEIASFAFPVSLALVFGQMIDGFATFLTLCSDPTSTVCRGATVFGLGVTNYGEKHPVAGALLQYMDGWGFPLAKLVLVLIVVILLDREAKQGAESDRQLVGLIQMAIFVLGFAPGFRDFLLVTFNFGGG
ncbi:MAG: DUF63 family protein [Thermoplasmatota archaeon]